MTKSANDIKPFWVMNSRMNCEELQNELFNRMNWEKGQENGRCSSMCKYKLMHKMA